MQWEREWANSDIQYQTAPEFCIWQTSVIFRLSPFPSFIARNLQSLSAAAAVSNVFSLIRLFSQISITSVHIKQHIKRHNRHKHMLETNCYLAIWCTSAIYQKRTPDTSIACMHTYFASRMHWTTLAWGWTTANEQLSAKENTNSVTRVIVRIFPILTCQKKLQILTHYTL